MNKPIVALLAGSICIGCVHTSCNCAYVSKSVNEHTGHDLKTVSKHKNFSLPQETSLADGLTAEESVAIA